MKYKAAIFDLDGTLVRTLPEHRYLVVGNVLKELGTTGSKEEIDSFWFEARRDIIIEDCFKLDPKIFWPVYQRHDKAEVRASLTKAYDDVGVIKEIKKAGIKTGIVTGAPPHIATLEIDLIGEENFDAIVVAHTLNGRQPKPHPSGLEECLNLLGVSKDEAIYAGNADEDILTARNAQVFDILLDRKEHKFPEINPSLTIYSLYELKEFLGI